MGFSLVNHVFWDTSIDGNPQMRLKSLFNTLVQQHRHVVMGTRATGGPGAMLGAAKNRCL